MHISGFGRYDGKMALTILLLVVMRWCASMLSRLHSAPILSLSVRDLRSNPGTYRLVSQIALKISFEGNQQERGITAP